MRKDPCAERAASRKLAGVPGWRVVYHSSIFSGRIRNVKFKHKGFQMNGMFRKIAIAATAAAAALCILAGCSKKAELPPAGTPEAAAYAFAQALYSGDTKSVISQLRLDDQLPDSGEGNSARKDQIRGKLEQGLSKVGKDVEAAGGIKDITVSKAEISEDGSTATTKVTVTFKKSKAKPQHEKLTLVKAGGEWAVKI